MDDYYSILGLSRHATAEQIKSAFRASARTTHPDVRLDIDGQTDEFLRVRQAYETLADPKRRQAYDASLPSTALVAVPDRPDARESSVESTFCDPIQYPISVTSKAKKVVLTGFGNTVYAIQRTDSAESDSYEYSCYVTLEEAYFGCRVEYSLSKRLVCELCSGSCVELIKGPPCNECNGSGHASNRSFLGRLIFGDPCVACGGKGFIERPIKCSSCKGLGARSEYDKKVLNVPPGVEDGSIIHGPNKSLPTKVILKPHKTFSRFGLDLLITKHLTESRLKKGVWVSVTDLRPQVHKVHVPPGSKDGTELRIPLAGMPSIGKAEIGDIVLRLKTSLEKSSATQAS